MRHRSIIATTLAAVMAIGLQMSADDSITFAIGSDFHAPDTPAGRENLQAFVDAATGRNADFIIELGDFCRLDSASKVYRDIWDSFNGDRYHVIGNHDMDSYTPDEYVEGMGMPGRYYSFDRGDFHFIILDGNNLFDGKRYTHYQKANFYRPYQERAYMDPEQMDWLRRDLASTDKRCILFSHQSIDTFMNNGADVRRILEEANRDAGFKKVVLAFSGHNHSNYTTEINGITYIQINSASYVWCDVPTASEKRYSKEINDRYPLLKYSITYDAPLFAIVTLTANGATIEGREAGFMPPGPKEVGLPDSIGVFPLVSDIKDAIVTF